MNKCIKTKNKTNPYIQFNSFYFILHRAMQILLFIKLSVSLINCTYTLFVFILTIYYYYRLLHYPYPGETGKELDISHAPLWSVDDQCSIALLIFIYI